MVEKKKRQNKTRFEIDRGMLVSKITAPLVYSAFVGNERAVRMCMQSGEWDTNSLENSLVYSCMLGHFSVVQLLTENRRFSERAVNRAFSYALLQDHLDVCMLIKTHADIAVGVGDIEQLVEMDRVDALELCYVLTNAACRSRLFSRRLFSMACLCKSVGVLKWFLSRFDMVEDKSDALLAVLRVQCLHKWVPRLVELAGVSDAALEYSREREFVVRNPLCSEVVLRARTKRRWAQIRGVFWFVVAYRRWLRSYYSTDGKGFYRARFRFLVAPSFIPY